MVDSVQYNYLQLSVRAGNDIDMNCESFNCEILLELQT